ncbi:MAG: hypothetical protein HC849_02640 [Oscillatoriales cyanobacterium RU_3_3]|nr:hypothetical protein [Microcoleus sp. SU_5_6]NJL68999.1 hypothetical protein [Microcoleus sp. SM1_3_4]NJM59339.1 hypothetical protein [Oscillatoriales cyanobacterium RU_3_3]NJR21535.1 hypothetical protein [Richelia sp. CSU_2_1]
MSQSIVRPKDTNAWIFQCWASFIIATSATAIGVCYLPVDIWLTLRARERAGILGSTSQLAR